MFNLALMIENGQQIPNRIWKRIGLEDYSQSSNFTQLIQIYQICLNDEEHEESHIPCTLALYNTKLNKVLYEYNFVIKVIFKRSSVE